MKTTQVRIAKLLLLSFAMAPVAQAGENVRYKIHQGETLSEIAYREVPGSVYNRVRGSLAKIRVLNPEIVNLDLVKPGQVVLLPKEMVAAAEEARGRKPAAEAAVLADDEDSEEADDSCGCAEEPEDKDAPYSVLSANVGFDYFLLDSQDRASFSNAQIRSRSSPTVALAWKLQWTPQWATVVSFRYRSEKLNDVDNHNKMLAGNGSSTGFTASLERDWNENSRSQVRIARDEVLFPRSLVQSTILFDRVGVTLLGLGHEQTLLRVKTASAGLGAQFSYALATSGTVYDVSSGWDGKAYAFVEQGSPKFGIRGELFLDKHKQDSSISTQSLTSTGLQIGFSWRLP